MSGEKLQADHVLCMRARELGMHQFSPPWSQILIDVCEFSLS